MPAIKSTVSLKCKLTAADELPVGYVWKVSLCIDSIDLGPLSRLTEVSCSVFKQLWMDQDGCQRGNVIVRIDQDLSFNYHYMLLTKQIKIYKHCFI